MCESLALCDNVEVNTNSQAQSLFDTVQRKGCEGVRQFDSDTKIGGEQKFQGCSVLDLILC
jgi:hypothetical protein